MADFSPERRERFLELIEAGSTIEHACATVGVSRPTITRWAARGRAEEGTEHTAFAQRLDRTRELPTGRLSEDDLVALLEAAARRGSVRACQLLLARLTENSAPQRAQRQSVIDELAARRSATT